MPSSGAAGQPASPSRVNSFYRLKSFATVLRPSWDTYREVKEIYRHSWLNILVVLIPLAVAAGALGWGPVAVFWLNFFALLPLGPLL